jgi:putative ATP-binding cassette transporter
MRLQRRAGPWLRLGLHVGLVAAGGIGALVLLDLAARPAAAVAPSGPLRAGLAAAFLLLLAATALLRRRTFVLANAIAADALLAIRERLAARLAALELAAVEGLPRGLLTDGLTRDADVLAEAAHQLAEAAQCLLIALVVGLYLSWLSPAAAGLVVAVAGIAAGAFAVRIVRHGRLAAAVAAADARLLCAVADLQSAAKETRLSAARRMAMLDELHAAAAAAAAARRRAAEPIADMFVLGAGAGYLIAGVIVFALPLLVEVAPAALLHLLAVTFFLLGPVFSTITALPTIVRGRAALAGLAALERRLDALPAAAAVPPSAPPPFRALVAAGLSYQHRDEAGRPGLRVGPIDLALAPGEIVFLTGANGSGKTTALRLVTGLYPASAGTLSLDGRPIAAEELPSYRELFAAVFADFHPPRRPDGLPGDRLPALRDHLAALGLAARLPADPALGFDPDRLSSGERRRLALALALAEDRPVLVLDEWAADQDPERRRWFYTELLPRLRAEGKAVLAVSHDERYFAVADRRIHLDEGRMVGPRRTAA